MRKSKLITLLLILLVTSVYGQEQVLDSARRMIVNKDYRSAFQYLKQADPENQNPDIVIQKTHLLTEYYVNSINHQIFNLKDLKKNESVSDYRGNIGTFKMFKFDPDSITRRLIPEYPDDHRLYESICDYWFDVYLKYNDRAEGRKSPLDTVKKFAKLAIEKGADDYDTYYKLGYSHTVDEKYGKAISAFKKSLKRNDTFPATHYNMAYSYLYTNQPSNTVIHANKAFELYDDSLQKADAARMAGITLLEMDKHKKAVSYLEKSLQYDPRNFSTLKNLLKASFILEDTIKADSVAEKIFAFAPANPGNVNRLYRLYKEENKIEQLIHLMKKLLKKYKGESEISGNIYFVLAKATMEEKPEQAREYLLKARENFRKAYPENHQVFEVVRQVLEHLEKTTSE